MFERGFKTWCESYAVKKRQELDLQPRDPLEPRTLAANLGIHVRTPHDFKGLSRKSLEVLLRNDGKSPSCWSAVTLVVSGKVLVILNSSHSKPRQASDLMHELAHRILGHETHEMDVSGDGIMLISSYDKQQEEEADWMSGCLLLPRDALVHIKNRRLVHEEAANTYGVSKSMLTYRLAMTGVNRQFSS